MRDGRKCGRRLQARGGARAALLRIVQRRTSTCPTRPTSPPAASPSSFFCTATRTSWARRARPALRGVQGRADQRDCRARRRRLGVGPARDGARQHDGATVLRAPPRRRRVAPRSDGRRDRGRARRTHRLAPGAAATLPECADGSSHVRRTARSTCRPSTRRRSTCSATRWARSSPCTPPPCCRRSQRRAPRRVDALRRRARGGRRGAGCTRRTRCCRASATLMVRGGRRRTTTPSSSAPTAPRPALLYSPLRDRFANATVAAAAKVRRRRGAAANASAALEVEAPDAPSDFRGRRWSGRSGAEERVLLGRVGLYQLAL